MIICNSEQHDGKSCDAFCNNPKPTFQLRAAGLARGATGRVCEVMWFCDDCAPDKDELVDVNAARAHFGDDADF
jgi:hypothetical protein